MKKAMAVFGLVAVAMILSPMGTVSAEDPVPVTLKGEAVDMQCYLGGRSGEAHASCAKSCVEGGQPVGFVAKDGEGKDVLYLVLGADRKPAKDYVAEHMGKQISASGTLVIKNGMKIFTVSKVEA